MNILDGPKRYHAAFGLRGVLAMSAYRLFGRPKEITVYPTGIRSPVHIRLRTSDVSTFEEILLRGEYAFDLPFAPKTIVDVGANIGMTSIYFAHKYPDARIIAIEAEAGNLAILERNVRPFATVTPLHAALWNRDGKISVDPSSGAEGNNWAFVTHEGPGAEVRAITMPTLISEVQIGSIDLLKIDIEGAEIEVFENCQWMSAVRCLMIELHDRFRPGCSAAVNPSLQGFSKLQKDLTSLYLREDVVQGARTVAS